MAELLEVMAAALYLPGVPALDQPRRLAQRAAHHLTCYSDRTNAARPGLAWLNGYRLDGSSVWSDERLEVVGSRGAKRSSERQPDLFEETHG